MASIGSTRWPAACAPRPGRAASTPPHCPQGLGGRAGSLRAKARAAGVYAPQLPAALGGLALSWRDCAVVLEELGRSFLGPIAAHCAAPDQPNMICLQQLGTPAQQ